MAGTRPPASSTGRSAVRLAPMEVPKASDVLADDLRERILEGEFEEGTALPTERDLVTQTRMSRTTVREALRILEVQGLVRIKAGRGGGAFVQRPGKESVASSVTCSSAASGSGSPHCWRPARRSSPSARSWRRSTAPTPTSPGSTRPTRQSRTKTAAWPISSRPTSTGTSPSPPPATTNC
jgi:DNA-binding transcriptional MocR family regulator